MRSTKQYSRARSHSSGPGAVASAPYSTYEGRWRPAALAATDPAISAAAACSPDDVGATLFQALGVEPTREVQTVTGRPTAVFRQGKVIEALLA